MLRALASVWPPAWLGAGLKVVPSACCETSIVSVTSLSFGFLSCKNTSREVDRPADGQSCSHRESGVLGAQTPLREVHRGQRL